MLGPSEAFLVRRKWGRSRAHKMPIDRGHRAPRDARTWLRGDKIARRWSPHASEAGSIAPVPFLHSCRSASRGGDEFQSSPPKGVFGSHLAKRRARRAAGRGGAGIAELLLPGSKLSACTTSGTSSPKTERLCWRKTRRDTGPAACAASSSIWGRMKAFRGRTRCCPPAS